MVVLPWQDRGFTVARRNPEPLRKTPRPYAETLVRYRAPSSIAIRCRRAEMSVPGGTPPCANSLLPPPRPPTSVSDFLSAAPMSQFNPGEDANTTDAGATSLANSATTFG